MATRRKQPDPVMFPFKGSDEENLASARRMAKAGLKKRAYKTKSVLPKALVHAVLVKPKTYAAKQKYLKAFIQELAAKELDDPRDGHSGGRSASKIDEAHPLGIRHQVGMHLDCCPEAPWDTEMARLKASSGVDKWEPIPDDKIDEIKNRRIPRSEWESWATDFLLFASEYSQLKATVKSRMGGIAKHERARSKPTPASSSSRRGE